MYSKTFERTYKITDNTRGLEKSQTRIPVVLARLSDLHRELNPETENLTRGRQNTSDFNRFELKTYRTFDEIKDLWCQFESHAACFIYQRFAFCRTWYETVGEKEKINLHMVVVSDQTGEPLMLVPLYLQQGRFGTVLQFIGDGMADYHAPLVQDDFANTVSKSGFELLWQEILATINETVDLVWLDRQPENIIGVKNPMTHLSQFEFSSSSHAVDFPPAKDWHHCARLIRSNKTAKKIERRLRQLSKQGKVELVEVTDIASRKLHMSRLLTLKVGNLNAAGTLHRMDKPDVAAFYQALVVGRSMQENLHQFELLCGGKLMASVLGFTHHGTFYYQVCAFNREDFSQYSPGLLLQYQLFDWSFSNGLKRFDMTIGDESYKEDWSNSTTALVTVAMMQTLRGRFEYVTKRALLRFKKTLKASPTVRYLFGFLAGK